MSLSDLIRKGFGYVLLSMGVSRPAPKPKPRPQSNPEPPYNKEGSHPPDGG